MIVHYFRCSRQHLHELWCRWDEETKPCPTCGEPARMIFLPRGQNAQNFDPVVIFRGPKGKVRFPGRANAPTPKGYERVELRTSHEVYKFEREMNAKEISRYHAKQEREERCVEPFRAALRSQLRGHARNFSQYGKDFASLAMSENDNRPRQRYDPGFHLEAFHYDSSNRDPWTDRDIGARGRK